MFELSSQDIAFDSIDTIKEAEPLFRKCNWLFLLTDASKSKFKNMSRRRKKKMVSVYISSCYYDKNTGQIIHPSKKHRENVMKLPIRIKATIIDLESVLRIPL